jgi:hypothetical protein
VDTQGFVAGPLSVLFIVALVMGTASAVVITAAGSTSNIDARPVHPHPSPESIISSLEQQGVDVTEVKTALQDGDTEAVQAWLEAHRPERPEGACRSPPDLTDPVQEQKIIDRLEEQGVDVSEVETDLENGDTTAVQAWLESYLHSHEGEMGSHHPPGGPPSVSQSSTTE